MIKFVDIHYQNRTEFINFSERDLINDESGFCSFSSWHAVSCFSVWKAFVKCPSLSVNDILVTSDMTSSPHNDIAFLTKFLNGLVHWSIGMVFAKNYETVSEFVKVMPILWRLFFPDTVYFFVFSQEGLPFNAEQGCQISCWLLCGYSHKMQVN